MRGILIRLEGSDSEAATALKIINYFESLADHRDVDFNGLVIGGAALAACPVGVQLADGRVFHSGDGEARLPTDETAIARSGKGHVVWLARNGEVEPTDALILERLAISADAVAEQVDRRANAHRLDDPRSLELLIRGDIPDVSRRTAAERLRLPVDSTVRLIILKTTDGTDGGAAAVALLTRARRTLRPLNVAVVDGRGVALVPDSQSTPLEQDIRSALMHRYGPSDSPLTCGISSAVSLDRLPLAWEQSRTALKFSIDGRPEQAVTTYEELGVASLLGELPFETLRQHPDVIALERLQQTPNGRSELRVLEVFCHNGSLRGAATSLHLHHSSVAAKLEHLEQTLGWQFDSHEVRTRARLAILALRLVTAE